MNSSRDHSGIHPRHRRLAVAVAAAVVFTLGACSEETPPGEVTGIDSTDASVAPTDASSVAQPDTTPAVADTSVLSDDEIAGLLWMREEEQLARDVYTVLGDGWDLRIFDNIAESESTHIAAVADLLDRYGLTDPAVDNQSGTFTDPVLQDLYDQLVADGSESLVAALRVGALIEELDIVDLQARSGRTDEAAILNVYANLEQGSRNHLRAFVSQLEARGVSYEPTQLDPAAFDAIVSSDVERGPGG